MRTLSVSTSIALLCATSGCGLSPSIDEESADPEVVHPADPTPAELARLDDQDRSPASSAASSTASSTDQPSSEGGQLSALASALVFSPTSVTPAAKPGFPGARGLNKATYTAGQILAANVLPLQGRVAAISYLNGWLYTSIEQPSSPPGSDTKERVWDISNPSAPRAFEALPPGQVPNPTFNAHGVLYKGDMVQAGAPLRAESFGGNIVRLDGAQTRAIGMSSAVGARGALSYPWQVWNMWPYHALPDHIPIYKRGVQQNGTTWNPKNETGIVGHPIVLGNLLIWASTQAEGVATYDISDPAHPVLLDTLRLSIGAYWPEVHGNYVIFSGKTFQVVDYSDPTNLRFVASIPTPDSPTVVYPHCQDDFCFYDTYKIDMRTVESPTPSVTRYGISARGERLIDGSHWQLPLGNLLVLGGNGNPRGGLSIVAHQAQPDTRKPFVSYHVPRPGQVSFPRGGSIQVLVHETLDMSTVNAQNVHLRALGASADVPVDLAFSGNGILSIAPQADLALGTTYTVTLTAGGIKDVAGNGIEGMSFSFSTGATSQGNRPPAISALSAAPAPVSPGAAASLQVTASDPNGPLSYRFSFGDGASTAWSATATASHSYAAAGHYTVTAQVKDALGAVASKTVGLTVMTAPPTGPRPTQSGRFAVAGGKLFVVNPDNSTITGLNLDTMAVSVPEQRVAANPRSLAAAFDGTLWIAARDADKIDIRSATGAALASVALPYGSAPEGLAMSPDGRTAFVTLAGSSALARINVATRTITGVLPLGAEPGALAVTADGARVLVSRLVSREDRGEVWDVASGATLTLSRTIPLVASRGYGSEPQFGDPDRADNARGVPNYLTGISISPDGKTAWVTAKKDNVYRGLFSGGAVRWLANVPFKDLLVEPADLTSDRSVRSILCALDLAAGAERLEERRDLDNSEGPAAVAVSPVGDYAFVALRGNSSVAVIDTLTVASPFLIGIQSNRGRYAVGAAPRSLWLDGARKRLWVYNDASRTVSVLNVAGLLARGEVASTAAPQVQVSGGAFETLTAAQLAGKKLFYDSEGKVASADGGDPVLRISAEGYIACASCHLDGGSDERVWDFTGRGEGLRNTASLLGRGGMAMGRVHWTANFDEIQDFENDIRGPFGGAGLMSDAAFAASSAPLGAKKGGRSAELDALAAYVSSFVASRFPRSPYRNPDGTMTAAAAHGRQIFVAEGCAGCHGGPLFTDSQVVTLKLHNVGTISTGSGQRRGGALLGLDTPTLLGLWRSAPYLHDGSAARLADVFTATGGKVLQAERGVTAGSSGISLSRTARGAKFVRLRDVSGTLTFGGVDGGAGGAGVITLRYGSSHSRTISLKVNGVETSVPLAATSTSQVFEYARSVSVPVTLAAGITNTIVISGPGGGHFDVDDIKVSTPAELGAAAPHRKVKEADRADLMQYLLQLDRPNG